MHYKQAVYSYFPNWLSLSFTLVASCHEYFKAWSVGVLASFLALYIDQHLILAVDVTFLTGVFTFWPHLAVCSSAHERVGMELSPAA